MLLTLLIIGCKESKNCAIEKWDDLTIIRRHIKLNDWPVTSFSSCNESKTIEQWDDIIIKWGEIKLNNGPVTSF